MSNKEHDSLDAMSSEFVAEIKDDLASLEPALLTMEEKGAHAADDLINHVFRSIHSIKGGAGFINFKELSSLSHAMENVLMRIREKKLTITSEIVDALLSGFDKMKLMVELLGSGQPCNYEDEITALKIVLNPETSKNISVETRQKTFSKGPEKAGLSKPRPKAKKPDKLYDKAGKTLQALKPLGDSSVFLGKEFFVDKKRLEKALNSQKFVYAVHIRFKNDLLVKHKDRDSIIDDIKSIGDILFSDLEENTGETGKDGFFCVIATILDLPLLSQVLEINKTQMTLVDRQFTDYETIIKGLSSKSGFGKATESPMEVISSGSDAAVADIEKEPKISDAPTTQTFRINVDLISRLMNRAGEMVLARKQLRPLLDKYVQDDSLAVKMIQNLETVTTDIQETIMQMRMQPIIDLMGKYKRVVRDIARRISKKVDFILEGADVEVDRNVLEKLANPVTHLIRNCIDHGIEFPEERLKLSKPETGTIRIKASHESGHVHIIISDDGKGIDPQLILSKAFEKGLVPEDQLEKLTDKQKINLIFLPGFTTSEQITDISGRGVGMDVVKTNIAKLRGQIEIESIKDKGTSVHLIIPLTLAIVPSLIVSSGGFRFAIPQVNIKEVIYLEPENIHKQVENIAGSDVLRLRGHLLPIMRLRNVLEIKTYIEEPKTGEKEEEKRKAIADRRGAADAVETSEKRTQKMDRRQTQWESTHVIILKLGTHFFGLCIDELHDIEEVVVEPLSEYIKHLKCFSGTAILGDGDVIMILDIPGIAAYSCLSFDTIKSEESKRNQENEKKTKGKGETRNLIIFSTADREYFALELKSISRLESKNPADIHYTGSMKYVEHDSQAVLLFSMDEFLPAGKCELSDKEFFAIFPKHISAKVGIIASKIIDTIETDEKLNKDATCPECVMGKLFIDNMMIQVLDHKKFADLIEHKAATAKESV